MTLETIRERLCHLGETIRDAVLQARVRHPADELAAVDSVTPADTIYRIDRISEAVIASWFRQYWPASLPVEVVMEGVESGETLTFPTGTPLAATAWKCILDPIDGTRCIMYDKRSAWMLAAVAPQRGPGTNLQDIRVAVMTEIPTTRAWRSDQVSAIRGAGRDGIRAEAVDLRAGGRSPFSPQPSLVGDFRDSFAGLSLFFPEGKAMTAGIEEELWRRLYGAGMRAAPAVFGDQYVSTGGQLFEMLVGHDRMNGDLRPLVFSRLGNSLSLTCHPYDICTAMILEEAGGVVEAPFGGPLDAPLDTTSPVAWMGYANPILAERVRPVLRDILQQHGLLDAAGSERGNPS